MTDKDKVGLLCILIILALVIWSRPKSKEFVLESCAFDIFQEKQEQELVKNIKVPDSKKMIQLWKTAEGKFGRSPFSDAEP